MTDLVTILGKVPSKSNCYRVVTIPGKRDPVTFKQKSHGSLAKTTELKRYESNFFLQIPPKLRRWKLDEEFAFHVDVYYEDRRPDLDNAMKVILDCLQKGDVIQNDRLCVEIHAYRHVDKKNPRIEFKIVPIPKVEQKTLGL